MATEDHLVPKSKGGSDLLDNLVLACNECNNQRGDMPAESFLRLKLEGRR
jgi:5-methylcytosine-specific restriction endonuclease McrA